MRHAAGVVPVPRKDLSKAVHKVAWINARRILTQCGCVLHPGADGRAGWRAGGTAGGRVGKVACAEN